MNLKIIGIVVIMTAVTYGARFLPLLAFRGKKLEGWGKDFLELIPVALLAVLILPDIITPQGEFNLINPYLITAVLTFIFARFVPNLLLGILFGMLVFWGINGLLG